MGTQGKEQAEASTTVTGPAAEGLQSHVAVCSVRHRLVLRVLAMNAHVHGPTSSAPCDKLSA
jgi:hypothetical protein